MPAWLSRRSHSRALAGTAARPSGCNNKGLGARPYMHLAAHPPARPPVLCAPTFYCPLTVARRETPLLLASRRGCAEVVESLLQRGATVDKAGREGRTPLMNASFFDHTPVVQALLGRWVGRGGWAAGWEDGLQEAWAE